MLDLCSRETYDPVNKVFDFRKKRTTDIKTNQRIYLPEPRPMREESELSVRNDIWEAEIRKYRNKHCDEEDVQTDSNLTASEKRGLKKLKKRADAGEIVIGTTDKSGKLCVSSFESYVRQGRKHVGEDRAVDWPEIYSIRRRMTCHARALVQIFNIGESHGSDNERRVRGAYQQDCDTIPILFTLPKDHKDKEENGDPKTRPVCGAKRSVNGRVGNLLSEVLRAVIEGEETDECISTEEMLHHMEVAAEEIAAVPGVRITVASEDAEALYPSLDIEQSARICAERVSRSEVDFMGIDYDWAVKYIAMNLTKDEAALSRIGHLLPVRKYKRGARPGIVSMEEEEKGSKWILRQRQLTEMEKRQILAEVIYHGVKTVFKNHVYQFEGQIRIQRRGGAIGGELTQVVARVVMDKWMEMFKEKMLQNNTKIYLGKKYVDDVNLILGTLKAGTKWNGTSLEWRKEWEEADLDDGEDDDTRTMREIRKLSNSLLPFIKFKEDVPANHESKKIPVLDFQVWAEEEDTDQESGTKTRLMFEFYEKPMASKLVIMENSALPHRMKITTLSQEIVRRMRNTCRAVSSKRRGEILSVYMRKLQRSGYSQATREMVATAGVKGYLRMVSDEADGGRRVNRPRQDGEEERRYKRLAGKSTWFKGSKKGANKEKKPRKRRGPARGKGQIKEIDTVMFVPHTPGDVLAQRLQEAEDMFVENRPGGKVKMVSRGGIAIKDLLSNKNPWSSEGCGRDNCFVCRSKPGRCQREGAVYTLECGECEARGIKASYFGETARSSFLRGLSHQALLKDKDDSSPLWKHSVEHHNAREDVVYTMKVMRNHPTALTRQIEESVAIDKKKVHVLMNSKGEWNSQRIPRIVVQVQGIDEEEEGIRLPTVESWAVPVRCKPKPKKRVMEEAREEIQELASSKRRRVGDNHDGDAAVPEAAGGEDGEQQGGAARGEGGRPEQKRKEGPLPVRVPQAKSRNRKTPSRGKMALADPRQKQITNFFNKNAEEMGKLESEDRLNLESDTAGQTSAAAGVGIREVGLSQESEGRNCREKN